MRIEYSGASLQVQDSDADTMLPEEGHYRNEEVSQEEVSARRRFTQEGLWDPHLWKEEMRSGVEQREKLAEMASQQGL